MASLSRQYRRQLERVVIEARRVGEKGAINSLKSLAVDHHEPLGGMTKTQRDLRNRLRAHGRQLGDQLDKQRGTQGIRHLATECAYEQWHRMLFARFLAENNLLIEPESGVALSLDDCRELAREKNSDWVELASSFAVKMLPQIFRLGDPVLEVALPPETHTQLEELLESLPTEAFAAEDSLGWVYQFWQAEEKKRVNASEVSIGAGELPAVTQLFTEDYIVLFLLHNTLGAWWTAKRKAEGKDPSLPGYEWSYLRLKEDGTPEAGSFDGWPDVARDLKVLDPCMGSGHFLTFALPIVVGFRMEEESLTREEAVFRTIRDNLFGLEIDNRCTQIGAFNLAFTAWRAAGYCPLPELNLACSGLGINAKEEDWVKLGGEVGRLRESMRRLFHMFQEAPVVGSLIDPKRTGGSLFTEEFFKVQPLLNSALLAERQDEEKVELAVTARGIVEAARLLSGQFTLVATNVPYLGRGRQVETLKEYCDRWHSAARADLATCFVERCLSFAAGGGTVAVVTQQALLFLGAYKAFRQRLLRETKWNFVARLGERAFDSSQAAGAFVALIGITREGPDSQQQIFAIDAAEPPTPAEKAVRLKFASGQQLTQRQQLENPDSVVALSSSTASTHLRDFARVYQGVSTTDMTRFVNYFWEQVCPAPSWEFFQMAPTTTGVSGFSGLLFWQGGLGELAAIGTASKGIQVVGETGVAVAVTRHLHRTRFLGNRFDGTLAVIIPFDASNLPAIASCVFSEDFKELVREVDQALSVTESSFGRIRFDLQQWRQAATNSCTNGIPKLESDDPTQWFFTGHPREARRVLQVTVCRLLGYGWPRQRGSTFEDCPALRPDGLETHADQDGIVPLLAIKGESAAADRLRSLLSDVYEKDWSAERLAELLSQRGYTGKKLEDWLRDGFFEQHCELFHQRPFVLHIWDGLKDGFGALVNYHKLAGPNGEGKRTLEKLIYTYLGDWIDRQRADQKNGVEGSDAKLAAAEHLQKELEKILKGEPPYDIFVRWKPLHEQPIGWEPDVNDGLRINIRPFMTAKVLNGRGKSACILRSTPKIKWDKDRGKEPHRPKEEFPWFWSWDGSTDDFAGGREFDGNRWNDLHYSIQRKHEARERHKGKKK